MQLTEGDLEQICDAFRESRDLANLACAINVLTDQVLKMPSLEWLKHVAEGRALQYLTITLTCECDRLEKRLKHLYDVVNPDDDETSQKAAAAPNGLNGAHGATEH